MNIESQVRNESGDQQSITLSAVVVDADGKVCAKFQGEASDLVERTDRNLQANGKLADAKFWSDEDPDLYDVYSMLTVNDKVVDVQKIRTGFRRRNSRAAPEPAASGQRQICLAHRLCAALGGRLGGPR